MKKGYLSRRALNDVTPGHFDGSVVTSVESPPSTDPPPPLLAVDIFLPPVLVAIREESLYATDRRESASKIALAGLYKTDINLQEEEKIESCSPVICGQLLHVD